MANHEVIITLTSIIQRSTENLLTSEVGEELVMMDIERGNYISLNKMGRIIWEQIEQPSAVIDLIKALTARFKVSNEQCTTDTLEYLQNMLAQKVISVNE